MKKNKYIYILLATTFFAYPACDLIFEKKHHRTARNEDSKKKDETDKGHTEKERKKKLEEENEKEKARFDIQSQALLIIKNLGDNPKDSDLQQALAGVDESVKTYVKAHYEEQAKKLKPKPIVPTPAPQPIKSPAVLDTRSQGEQIIKILGDNPRRSDILRALAKVDDQVKAFVQNYYAGTIKAPSTPSPKTITPTPTPAPTAKSPIVIPAHQRKSILALNLKRVKDSDYKKPTATGTLPDLLRWLNEYVRDYGFVINNLRGAMKDGRAFCALADIVQDGTYQWCEDFNTSPDWLKVAANKSAQKNNISVEDLNNFRRLYIAFEVLGHHGVAQLLDAEDTVETQDQQSIMTYLFKIQSKFSSL